jgi:hypothetical protein
MVTSDHYKDFIHHLNLEPRWLFVTTPANIVDPIQTCCEDDQLDLEVGVLHQGESEVAEHYSSKHEPTYEVQI